MIMLAAVDLDLTQSVSMAIGVQRQTDMNPITIVFAGINDHLHSRGSLSRLREPTTAEAGQSDSRIAALRGDSFEQGPVMIMKIHAYLVKEVNLAENAEEKSAEFVNRVCQVTLKAFWTQKVKGEEGFDRTDSMLEGLGAGCTASFLAKIYRHFPDI